MKKLNILLAFLLIFFTSPIFSQNFESNNFRGQRRSFESEELTLKNCFVSRTGNGCQIELYFSEPVPPKSISGSTIKIDGKPLSSSSKITFNRDGTIVRIQVSNSSISRINLSNIKAFSGNILTNDSIIVDNLD